MKNVVVMAYLFYEDKVLLTKHKDTGLWLPVGGHVEDGETIEEALSREVSEEVNLRAEFLRPKKIYEDDESRKRMPLPFYIQTKDSEGFRETIMEFVGMVEDISSFNLEEEELTDSGWFSLEEVEKDNSLNEVVREKIALAYRMKGFYLE